MVKSENEDPVQGSTKELDECKQDDDSSVENQMIKSAIDGQESKSTELNNTLKSLRNNQAQNSENEDLPKQIDLDHQIKLLDKVEEEDHTPKTKDPQSALTRNFTDQNIKVEKTVKTVPTWTKMPFGKKDEKCNKSYFTVTFKPEDEIEEISLIEDSSDDEIATDSDDSEDHLITIGDDDEELSSYPIGSTPPITIKPMFHSNLTPITNLMPMIDEKSNVENDADMTEELEEGEIPRQWKFNGPLHNGHYTSGKWYDVPEAYIILTDYKEKSVTDIYFPENGPYWCEICHNVVETNKDFVDHVRINHLDVADEDVLCKMESRLQ